MGDFSSVSDPADRAALANVSFANSGMYIPPLNHNYLITVHAYVYGRSDASHDDNPTAYMRLYLNGGEVAYRYADHFQGNDPNIQPYGYDFRVDHQFAHMAGQSAQFQFEHSNTRADELGYGMSLTSVASF